MAIFYNATDVSGVLINVSHIGDQLYNLYFLPVTEEWDNLFYPTLCFLHLTYLHPPQPNNIKQLS